VVRALSPDRQTGFAVYCGSDISFAYLQNLSPRDFGLNPTRILIPSFEKIHAIKPMFAKINVLKNK
jgi:hypothetical protein